MTQCPAFVLEEMALVWYRAGTRNIGLSKLNLITPRALSSPLPYLNFKGIPLLYLLQLIVAGSIISPFIIIQAESFPGKDTRDFLSSGSISF